MNTNPEPSGHELKVERVARRAKQGDVASAMGVSVSRIRDIEREQYPSSRTVARYRAALDTWATSPTSEAA